MKKLLIVLLSISTISLLLSSCNEKENQSGDAKKSGEAVVVVDSGDTENKVVFNTIEDIIYGQDDSSYRELIADDGEIPDEIINYMDRIVKPYNLKKESATIRYTKSDPSQSKFNLKHDYVVFYQGEDRYNSIGFVISTVENTIRTAYIKSTEIPSIIDGKEVLLYYENNGTVYIYLNKDDMHVELTIIGRKENEIIDIIKNALQ